MHPTDIDAHRVNHCHFCARAISEFIRHGWKRHRRRRAPVPTWPHRPVTGR